MLTKEELDLITNMLQIIADDIASMPCTDFFLEKNEFSDKFIRTIKMKSGKKYKKKLSERNGCEGYWFFEEDLIESIIALLNERANNDLQDNR